MAIQISYSFCDVVSLSVIGNVYTGINIKPF